MQRWEINTVDILSIVNASFSPSSLPVESTVLGHRANSAHSKWCDKYLQVIGMSASEKNGLFLHVPFVFGSNRLPAARSISTLSAASRQTRNQSTDRIRREINKQIDHRVYLLTCLGQTPRVCKANACSRLMGKFTRIHPRRTQSKSFKRSSYSWPHNSAGTFFYRDKSEFFDAGQAGYELCSD